MNIEKKAGLLSFVSTLLLIQLFWIIVSPTALASSDIIWVPDDYPTIQAAINAANEGEIIKVRAGTYNENVRVNKTLKLIGEGFPTIDGYLWGSMWGYPTVDVTADNVTISGFIILHRSYKAKEYDVGIDIWSNGNNISGNIIRSNADGIYVGYLHENNTVSNNMIEQNWDGIFCDGYRNNFSGNIISNNSAGMVIWRPSNSLINNTIVGNHGYGIWPDTGGEGTILRNNNMTGNGFNLRLDGFYLWSFLSDIDTSNTVNGKPVYYWINQHNREVPADAGYVGIINSSGITVGDVSLERNGQGVLIAYSSNITIRDSNISNNIYGIYLRASSNNTIYHNNFINNTFIGDPFGLPMLVNTWDGGYPSGGNYWSNYADADLYHGPHQNETGSDGIRDAPYVVDANNRDNYPLMSPYEYWSDPTPGDVNKDTKVDHKDLSQLAASYGSTPEKPNWNPNADTNDDGKVNYKDLFTLAANYGKKFEYP